MEIEKQSCLPSQLAVTSSEMPEGPSTGRKMAKVLFDMRSTEKPPCRSQANYEIAYTGGVPAYPKSLVNSWCICVNYNLQRGLRVDDRPSISTDNH